MGCWRYCAFEDELIGHFLFRLDEVQEFSILISFWNAFYEGLTPLDEHSPDSFGLIKDLSITILSLYLAISLRFWS